MRQGKEALGSISHASLFRPLPHSTAALAASETSWDLVTDELRMRMTGKPAVSGVVGVCWIVEVILCQRVSSRRKVFEVFF